MEISTKIAQILDIFFFIKREKHMIYENRSKITYRLRKSHIFTTFLKIYENRMVVFVLKIAKPAWFLYGVVQKLDKNWTIFFHRATAF